MKISKLLDGSAPITVQEDDNLALALQVMLWGGIRHLPVLRGAELVGVLSERDVLRCYAEAGKREGAARRVSSVMSSPPVTIGTEEEVADALRLLTETGVGCLPVVRERRLIGLLTRRDLLRDQLEGEEHAPEPTWTHHTVDEVMSPGPMTAAADDNLLMAIERMEKRGVRHLPVVDGERRVVGMLSDRDVRTAVGNPLRSIDRRDAMVRIRSLRVDHAMTRQTLTIHSGTRLSQAIALFADHKVGAVPVVDDQERLTGIVSYLDILRAVLGRKATAD